MKHARFALPVLLAGGWLLAASLVPATARAEPMPALHAVPAGLPAEVQTTLSREREALEAERNAFLADAGQFNAKPAEAQTDAEFAALRDRRGRYVSRVTAFNREIAATLNSLAQSDPRNRIINGMNALAARLGWSDAKKAQLARALNDLGSDGDPHATGLQIRMAWMDILERSQSGDSMPEAKLAEGPNLSWAGDQTQYCDCAIFALANAAGLPYGVAAARATKLIREGHWRDAGERANPEEVIEQQGLKGGEVVMLAVAFGQAEVVRSSNFARTIRQGRPVMINVVPSSGSGAHEVVLTKTFQHDGATWYGMMDSQKGPSRTLYVSEKELNTILQEKGVAFSPEAGTTVDLLR